MTKAERVFIFDTTLRDGQQCPGAGMSFERNLQYAHLAARVGVDILEAGFPSASENEFRIVQRIADELASLPKSPTVAALCQLRPEQVETTIRSLEPAKGRARLHVYVPVDPNLAQASLSARAVEHDKFVKLLNEQVKIAFDAGLEVEFSPEGYSRVGANFDYTTELILAAVEAGASVINCPDTIGGGCYLQGKDYFVELMNRHSSIVRHAFPDRPVIWSAHCHNDFGLALHNSIQAVVAGPARQIEGCFNGIGERAGNVSLEQCVMVLKHFGNLTPQRFYTEVKTELFVEISDFVSNWMLPRQPHQPVVGDNSARHSSGGHTNAILNNPLAYQPFDPKEVGKEVAIVFGPLSGGNHAKSIIQKRGFACNDAEKAEIAQYLKTLYGERRKGITDEELLDGYRQYRHPIQANDIEYARRKDGSEVVLRGRFFSENGEFRERCSGADSALAALKLMIDSRFPGLTLESYTSSADRSSIHAASISSIVLRTASGERFEGVASDQDIELSALKALIDGVNRAWVETKYRLNPEPLAIEVETSHLPIDETIPAAEPSPHPRVTRNQNTTIT